MRDAKLSVLLNFIDVRATGPKTDSAEVKFRLLSSVLSHRPNRNRNKVVLQRIDAMIYII